MFEIAIANSDITQPNQLTRSYTVTPDYPLARPLWSPNFGYPNRGDKGREGHLPVAVVYHIEAGSEGATLGWFGSPASNVSAHYSIARDGRVYQHVLEFDAAWAQGIDFSLPKYKAYADLSVPWIADCYRDSVSPNLVAISIEHEGQPGQPLTAIQYEASLLLTEAIFDRYLWRIEWGRLSLHSQVNGVDRPNCPGSAFPFARLYADLAAAKR